MSEPVDEPTVEPAPGPAAGLDVPAEPDGSDPEGATEPEPPDPARPLRDVLEAAGQGVERRDVDAENAARALVGSGTAAGDRLGRLADWGIWLAGIQSTYPPRPLDRVRILVVGPLPGSDHEVHRLAAQTSATLEPVALQADSSPADAARAGVAAVDAAVDAGCDLLVMTALVAGDVSATLVALLLRLSATEVVGDSPHLDDVAWADLVAAIRDRTHFSRSFEDDPVALLQSLGSAELAALAAMYLRAAARRTPVLLDGAADGAAALAASRGSILASWWWFAAVGSGDPATRRAVEALGLEPLVQLDSMLDGGAGALTALPLLRAAGRILATG